MRPDGWAATRERVRTRFDDVRRAAPKDEIDAFERLADALFVHAEGVDALLAAGGAAAKAARDDHRDARAALEDLARRARDAVDVAAFEDALLKLQRDVEERFAFEERELLPLVASAEFDARHEAETVRRRTGVKNTAVEGGRGASFVPPETSAPKRPPSASSTHRDVERAAPRFRAKNASVLAHASRAAAAFHDGRASFKNACGASS